MNVSGYMIVQGDNKFIYYSKHRYQLFNLKDDPEELKEIHDENIARKLRNELLRQIDIRRVTKEVENYNKSSFLEWRNQQGANYSNAISNLRWAEHFNQDKLKNLDLIERWLYSLPSATLKLEQKRPK
ncbi:unnamed protein product [Oikopleura dioica]|nr:unnamed protein product [Oikopleura dioica]